MVQKKFDITLKDLIDKYPRAWAELVGAAAVSHVEVRDADIATLTAEADKVLQIESNNESCLLNLEMQADHELGWPGLLLYKSVALHRRHQMPVRTVIVLLRRKANASDLTGQLKLQCSNEAAPYLVFKYLVLRLWKLPLQQFMEGSPGLLPLASLTDEASKQLPRVLRQIDARIRKEVSSIEGDKLREAIILLLGLRNDMDTVQRLAEGVLHMTLESSSVYQWILAKGQAEGEAKGLAEGQALGLAEGRLQEVKSILLRLGSKKLGRPEDHILARLNELMDLSELEELLDRLLLVDSWGNLLD